MAAVFDETAILTDVIDYSAISGGPEKSTTVIASPFSGVSQRNVNRLDPLHRYTITTALLTQAQMSALREFFHCRDGMARGFRMKDCMEFWASSDGSFASPIATPNNFGTGNGSTTVFGLYKTYSSGGVTRTRRIVKPVSGSVSIYKNGVLQTLTTDYTIDYTTGIVTFTSAPTNGHALTWTGMFHIPVRFATDYFNVATNDAITAISYDNLPLLEIPAAEFELAV
ncbi:MAG: TIGR02217 family protein [Acidobacteria bacterium]|nr:TIGR02217 family protein [Acidobacteriota bacterium]